ncbi:MAG: alpha/beta fold hydrolase [Rhodobacteraceae bacterium]|nr:alpha/beta fold hydrolase [Paracoccaceae bacterium]
MNTAIPKTHGASCLPFQKTGLPSEIQCLPVVLLHGFGGVAKSWRNIQVQLQSKCVSIAFDLPGHGEALHWPEIGHAGISAKHVTRSLDALELDQVHLVGHSMGGAVASLIALRNPKRVASLTLLSPGGFGPEINGKLLREFAAASEESALSQVLPKFFNADFKMPKFLIQTASDQRQRPGQTAALETIVNSILTADGQNTLPLDDLSALGIPISVIWGEEDRIIPVEQAHRLQPPFKVTTYEAMGHMPHLEQPTKIIREIFNNMAIS